MKFLVLNLFVMIAASISWAGNERGGGNAVVCFDNPAIPIAIRSGTGEILDDYIPHVASVETFDLYEARQCRGLDCSETPKIIPVNEGESPFEYTERIAKRFDGAISEIARFLRDGMKKF